MKKSPLKFLGLALLGLALALPLLLTGCRAYRLGSTLNPRLKTVFIPVFVNQAGYPQLETRTTAATIEEFQRDGTLRVAERETSDLVIEVTLQRYLLQPLRYNPNRTTTATEYRILMDAVMTVRGRDGKVLMADIKIRGESTFEFSGDIATARQQALPQASRDMAHRIVETVVEAW
jgi:hypothetical protein